MPKIFYLMKTIFKISNAIFAILMVIFVISCNKKPENQIDINVDIDFTIYPNSIQYQELNVVGGWMYLTSPLPSYGIIVYKMSIDEFMAYDRKPLIYNDLRRGALQGIRTPVLLVRSQTLYPTELAAHVAFHNCYILSHSF